MKFSFLGIFYPVIVHARSQGRTGTNRHPQKNGPSVCGETVDSTTEADDLPDLEFPA
jgi:hypothetical protein